MRRAAVRAACAVAGSGAALMAGATAIGVPSSTGCYTHQCDPPLIPPTYSGGEMVDEDHYETSPIQQPDSGVGSDEPWLPFPPNATLTVTFPPAAAAVIAGRVPYEISPSIGLSAQPNAADSTFTPAAGALGEFNLVVPNGFTVQNNTCSNYFARFVVTFPAFPADASAAIAPNVTAVVPPPDASE